MIFQLLQRLESGHIRTHTLPLKEPVSVSENDALCLWSRTDEPLMTEATIWLSDVPFPVEPVDEQGLVQAAFWYNPEGNQTQQTLMVAGQSLRFCKPLMNQFGRCRISFQAGPGDVPQLLLLVDVESAKLTPTELTDLLDYLMSQGVSYWRAEAGLTRVETGAGSGPLSRLGRLQRDLMEWEKLWPAFQQQPATRLTPRPAWEASHPAVWSERTMHYLIQHPDALRPANEGDPDSIRWRRQWLSADYALTDRLTTVTDTPENRAIHGYFHQALDWLRQQREPEPSSPNPLPTLTGKATVTGLRDWQRQHFAGRYNAEIDHLSRRLARQLNQWQTELPVSNPQPGLPPGQAGFGVSEHYFRAGQVLARWYEQMGEQPNTDTEPAGLTGVQTLDRLYELLCLFKIQEVIATLGYELTRWQPRQNTLPDRTDDDRTGSYYFAHPDGHRIRLHYETIPDTYLNVGRVNGLLPDFILEYLPATGDAIGLILDAKYRRLRAVRFEQADLTLKYLHGLVPKAGLPQATVSRSKKTIGPVRTEALLILHPTDSQDVSSYNGQGFYQKSRFDLFSQQTSHPLIGTVEVAASAQTAIHLERVLRALLIS